MSYIVYGKRFGGEHLDIREFITPYTPSVQEALAQVALGNNQIWNIWDWVCANIKYPPICGGIQDYHEKISFLKGCPIIRAPVKRSTKVEDFWELPWEVLDPPCYGDCEGSSVVLVSMLRNILPASAVFCNVGMYKNFGHAWTTFSDGIEDYILDSTIPQARAVGDNSEAEADLYVPYIKFNDQIVTVERDGWQLFLNNPM